MSERTSIEEKGREKGSWTPTDPRTVPNYRDAAGLPELNTGEFLAIGRLVDRTGVTMQLAESLGGRPGGGIMEYYVPSPRTQIYLLSNLPVEPPF